MTQKFQEALNAEGYEIVDSFEDLVAVAFSDISVDGVGFDEMEMDLIVDDADGLRFGAVDAFNTSGFSDEQKTILNRVGVEDDADFAWELEFTAIDDHDEIEAEIREIWSRV